jgi:glycerophosphoryl diester phosphodiesterase
MWVRRPAGRPLVLGHRGASAVAAENSVEAFRRAAHDGADGVELDVLCCATGEVVVFHDDDLVRLGGRPERIADLPLGAIREVKLTSGASIPTLEEAFEACGSKMLVNVELKAAPGAWGGPLGPLVDRVAAIVERTGTAPRVLVSSFHPRAIYLWMRRAPDVRAGLLFERESSLPMRQAWAAPLLQPFALHPEFTLCHRDSVARWHARGYMVNVWTVDDPSALRAAAAMDIDAIITNDPARARGILDAGP